LVQFLGDRSGDFELARIKASQGLKVVRELAKTMPQLSALLMAAAAGYRQIEDEVVVREDRHYPVDVRFLGIKVATYMQHDYTIKTHTRNVRLKQ